MHGFSCFDGSEKRVVCQGLKGLIVASAVLKGIIYVCIEYICRGQVLGDRAQFLQKGLKSVWFQGDTNCNGV